MLSGGKYMNKLKIVLIIDHLLAWETGRKWWKMIVMIDRYILVILDMELVLTANIFADIMFLGEFISSDPVKTYDLCGSYFGSALAYDIIIILGLLLLHNWWVSIQLHLL